MSTNEGQANVTVESCRGHLGPQAVEEAVQRMLARRVGGACQERRVAGDAGDGHQHAAAREQVRQGRLRDVHGAEEVDFDDAADDFGRGVCQRAVVADAGVGEEPVDAAEVRHRARDGRLAGGAVGDVAAKGEQVAAVPREFSR
ncbi:MAG: hypothetical protein U1F67_03860 [Rubrivivax sp.]